MELNKTDSSTVDTDENRNLRGDIHMPEEGTCKSIKKSLRFNSGETLSIELSIENVSPQISKDEIIPIIDTLFERAKEVI